MTSMTQIVDGQTGTGASTAYNVGQLRGLPRGSGTYIGVHVSGITTGTVQVQFGPTSTGPWLTAADGELTADSVLLTPASDNMWIRCNVTVATDIDLDVYAG